MSDKARPQKLSVIVPCFNEGGNLRRFSAEVIAVLKPHVPALEIILVDDGSTDETRASMEALTQEGSVILCRHEKNRGLGAALRTGFAKATGDAILTLDADLTFHPREFPILLSAYREHVDCVMGSPLLGRMQGVPPFRRFLSYGVNLVYGRLFGGNLSATSSLFRLYRASVLKSLDIESTSFDINAEILFKLLVAGRRVVEVPVTLGVRTSGVSKIRFAREIKNHLKMFLQILAWKAKAKT